jgi:hypothetical protein
MAKLEFKFERGGLFVVDIFDKKVPKTWECIKAVLPITRKAYNARWTGRESHTPMDLPVKPPRENQQLTASLGDVIYACEWPPIEVTGFEAIGWFYGPEQVRDWRGPCTVNYIGRIAPQYWDFLVEVGLRTWRQGGEDCTIRVLEA